MNHRNDADHWIAGEIHDGLMAWVTGALMQLGKVQAAPESQVMLEAARHCLRQASEEGRSLIHFLDSCSTDSGQSLEIRIAELVERLRPLVEQSEQSISHQMELCNPTPLSRGQMWAILRIIQQAVQNAIQHAGPATIAVRAEQFGASLVIEISDTGAGFDTSAPPAAGHFGLGNMQQRAESIPGRIEWESGPGMGTRVRLTVHP